MRKEIDLRNPAYSLCLVTDRALSLFPFISAIEQALKGGVGIVQLREKKLPFGELVILGRKLLPIVHQHNGLLIVNDNVRAALEIGADGVHVGQDDMSAKEARALIGPDKILGVSASTTREAWQAEQDGADYIGVGSIFATTTKSDAGDPVGVERITEVSKATTLPAFAIGGIDKTNAADVIRAGADGIAVVSAIMASSNPQESAQTLFSIILSARKND